MFEALFVYTRIGCFLSFNMRLSRSLKIAGKFLLICCIAMVYAAILGHGVKIISAYGEKCRSNKGFLNSRKGENQCKVDLVDMMEGGLIIL